MFCNGYNPVQALVSEREALAVNEPALKNAIIWKNCGSVYVHDPKGQARVLGTLREAGRSYTWKSAYVKRLS